ncbi:MAG TPA: tetratricopeptide repeat protein [Candidatus Obscuribacterales bacterium]
MNNSIQLALLLFAITAGRLMAAPIDDIERARDLYEHGKYADAIRLLDKEIQGLGAEPAGRRRTAESYARMLRGLCYQFSGDNNRAVADFTRCLTLKPSVEGFQNRANSYFNMGKYDLALADVNSAIRLDPRNGCLFNNRGNIYERLGQLEKALADMQSACALHRTEARHVNARGKLYLELGQAKEGESDFERAASLATNQLGGKTDNIIVLEDLARAYLGQRQYSKARDTIETYHATFPESKELLASYAYCTSSAITVGKTTPTAIDGDTNRT